MSIRSSHPSSDHMRSGTLMVVIALSSTAMGAAFAKMVIQSSSIMGAVGLRIAIAALIIAFIRRPWKRQVPRELRPALFIYGIMLGLMNLLIYESFSRIPIGIAVAIEALGPLSVALLQSRRVTDLLWLGIAVAGLVFLIPRGSSDHLNWTGVAFAAASGVCWALYIVSGKRVAAEMGGDAAAWGLLIATLGFLPAGIVEAGSSLLTANIVGGMIIVAVLSSALPYSLEIKAMQRLPSGSFALISSAAPPIGALAGYLLLAERLTSMQWSGILCIVIASAGGALAAPTFRQRGADTIC